MPKMRVGQFKKRYDAITIPERRPGELDWVDRLRTWKEFITRGKLTADLLADVFKCNDVSEYDRQFRQLCPPLHDLLMEAYDKAHVLAAFRTGQRNGR